ncbi:hypothetical protein KR038_000357 [Drosophila bunnanda]|nr:hypothetical protein KR038_000357 [Drosophila bunnanda]
MDAQFEHLCRICAANTKSKTNSVVESVFIFKTRGLKDKISRHLYLNVAEDDPLPKVLCKSCYRQVEATASLSNIAKHTQLVFRDFLLSTLPKNAREAAAARLSVPPAAQLSERGEDNLTQNDEFRPIILTHVPETTITVSKPQPGNRPQEDGGNVATRSNQAEEFRPILLTRVPETTITVSKPQTETRPRDDGVVASKVKEPGECVLPPSIATAKSNLLPTRRSSVFVDSRYGSAPMSIAQRSMQHLPSLVPLTSEVSAIRVSKKNTERKLSPAGVINFIQTHGRITGNVPVVGKNDNSRNTRATTAITAAQTNNSQGTGMANMPSNVLQQKRRNLKNALNNIKAINSGQVSLLKSAQIRNPVDDIRPSVTATVVPQEALYGCEPSVEEALPEHMIFAAPKKKREDEEPVVQAVPPKLKKGVPASQSKSLPLTLDLTESSASRSHVLAPTKSMPNVKSLTDAISLGSVIRDPDLLMLILKALKWPVSAGNCEEQMARLKCSKFAVIMSDNNLLQDTDLTQLLGPYLGPMLAVAQQQDKHAVSTAIVTAGPNSSLPATKDLLNLTDLSSAMPYKLPPETSVQLVPSSPTELEHPPLRPTKTISVSPVKRFQRKARTRHRETGQPPASTSNAEHVSSELLNIDAMLLSQFGSNPADALNEALISLLKQQQESKEQRSSRRRRSPSSSMVNLEDIVLVEPQPLEPGPHASDVAEDVVDDHLAKQPSKTEPPVITRPIVKRRRTVVQVSKPPGTVGCSNRDTSPIKTQKLASSGVPEETLSQQSEKTVHEVMQSIEKLTAEPSQAPTSTVPEAASHLVDNLPATAKELPEAIEASSSNRASGDTENDKAETAPIRKSEVKAALGQKLLEAIGLPQLGKDVAPESSRDTLRSALKRSLKQAQEQQQQLKRVKQEEPVKQLADSTTKLSAAESADERKKVIAERELALLKRKTTTCGDDTKLSVKDEKSERTDVSSSSSRNRRSRKSKTDTAGDSGDEERKLERWDDDDELPLKTDAEKAMERSSSSSSNIRPTRTSKSLSKYYKGPSPKSQHAMGTRSTRQR